MIRKFVPKTKHIKNNTEKMNKWVKELPAKIEEIKQKKLGKEIEINFQDESRFGQMTIKAGIWSPAPIRPEFKTQNGFLNSWIYGAIHIESGKNFGLMLSTLDNENMHIFFNSFSRKIKRNEHILLVLDGSRANNNNKIKIPKKTLP